MTSEDTSEITLYQSDVFGILPVMFGAFPFLARYPVLSNQHDLLVSLLIKINLACMLIPIALGNRMKPFAL